MSWPYRSVDEENKTRLESLDRAIWGKIGRGSCQRDQSVLAISCRNRDVFGMGRMGMARWLGLALGTVTVQFEGVVDDLKVGHSFFDSVQIDGTVI